MMFNTTVQLRTVSRNNIGAQIAGIATNWHKTFISIVVEPKYQSKPNLTITSAIEVIAANRNLPQILRDRTQQYAGDLECKIFDHWAKILLIDFVKSPKTNIEFIKIVVDNQPRGTTA